MTAALIIVSLGVFVFLFFAGVGVFNYLSNKNKEVKFPIAPVFRAKREYNA